MVSFCTLKLYPLHFCYKGSAKFDKKKRKLTVTLPVMPHSLNEFPPIAEVKTPYINVHNILMCLHVILH